MLHDHHQLRMTGAEWRTLSAMGLEHESSLKRRLRDVGALRRWLHALLEHLEDVPAEVVLLRTVFVPWYLERLGPPALDEVLAGAAPGFPHADPWAGVAPVGREFGAEPGDD